MRLMRGKSVPSSWFKRTVASASSSSPGLAIMLNVSSRTPWALSRDAARRIASFFVGRPSKSLRLVSVPVSTPMPTTRAPAMPSKTALRSVIVSGDVLHENGTPRGNRSASSSSRTLGGERVVGK